MPLHNHSGSSGSAGNHRHSIQCWGWSGADNTVSSFYSQRYQLVGYTDYAGNHTHNIYINSTGSNQAHNNLQPYISVYMWQRTT